MPRIVSIQFSTAGKLYDFNAGEHDLHIDDSVVVETERGLSIGKVLREPVERTENLPPKLVTVTRKATPDDFALQERVIQKEKEAYDFCLKRIVERNMQMKLVKVECQFDESKAVFFFTADGRVDFRDLVKDLAHTFHTRIEMRQIGVRDEAKMIGGIGICGRELCCCSFLREFQPVSVKMAKEQNLALNPNKISGQCGRLLCCLDYEYETYCSLRKTFPKCGKRGRTVAAQGTIDKINILTGAITLRLDDGKLLVVKRSELIGEAFAGEEPGTVPTPAPVIQPPASKQPERRERQRSSRPPRQQAVKPAESATIVTAEAAPIAEPTPHISSHKEQLLQRVGDQEQRTVKKRNRNRRHGHRKSGDSSAPPQDNPQK